MTTITIQDIKGCASNGVTYDATLCHHTHQPITEGELVSDVYGIVDSNPHIHVTPSVVDTDTALLAFETKSILPLCLRAPKNYKRTREEDAVPVMSGAKTSVSRTIAPSSMSVPTEEWCMWINWDRAA